MRTVVLSLLPAVMLGACASDYTLKDRFLTASRLYNDAVHWQMLEDVVHYLPKDEQHPFVERMEALEDDLEIATTDLVQYDIDKKHDRVKARLSYTWSLKRRGILEKTVTEQTWQEKNGKLVMLHEVRLRGSALPIWKERAEVPADPVAEEKEKKDDKEHDQWKYGATAGGPGPGSNLGGEER